MPPILHRRDRLLLRAATADGQEALDAWREWLGQVRLDDIEPANFPVLPAVARHLEELGMDYPEAGRLRGVCRYTWAQNQITFRDLSAAVPALTGAQVFPLAHRGLPIVVRYGGDAAASLADQVDLLVAPLELERAIAALTPLGWVPTGPVPPPPVRPAFHAVALVAPGRRRIVLHWRCLPFGIPDAFERQIHDRAAAFDLQGLPLAIPDPMDQALIGLARLEDLTPEEALRWTLQQTAVLSAVTDLAELDRRAIAIGLASMTGPALRSASGHDAALSAGGTPAAALPPTSTARLLRALPRTWRRYQGVCRSRGRRATPWGFAWFLPMYYRYVWRPPAGESLSRIAIQRVLAAPVRADASQR